MSHWHTKRASHLLFHLWLFLPDPHFVRTGKHHRSVCQRRNVKSSSSTDLFFVLSRYHSRQVLIIFSMSMSFVCTIQFQVIIIWSLLLLLRLIYPPTHPIFLAFNDFLDACTIICGGDLSSVVFMENTSCTYKPLTTCRDMLHTFTPMPWTFKCTHRVRSLWLNAQIPIPSSFFLCFTYTTATEAWSSIRT